jgi:two-component system, response regulator PdtaR
MTRSPFPAVSGRCVRLRVPDPRDAALLHRQLGRMGVRVVDEGAPDATILDIDGEPGLHPPCTDLVAAPVIALVGTETPSRLRWMLDREPAALLVKPLRSTGLYAALVMALHAGERRRETLRRIEGLEARIRCRRVVVGAVVATMAQHAMSEAEAFALLRRRAMARRITIEALSTEIAASGAARQARA